MNKKITSAVLALCLGLILAPTAALAITAAAKYEFNNHMGPTARRFQLGTVLESATLGVAGENGEILNNTTDDTIQFLSDDNDSTFNILGFEAKDAILQLWADQGDDAADKYSFTSDASTNKLTLKNNATAILTFSSAGVQTLADSETFTDASDVITFAFDDAAATVKVAAFEATDSSLILQADESDDSGDDWQISSVASGNALTFSNDTSGSQVVKLSLSTAGVITYSDSETLTDSSDVLTFGFDDAAAEMRLNAFEATNASLTLQADESDDNGDDWKLSSVASGNSFTIANDTSGSQVAKFTMAASDGDITLTGGITGDGGDTVSGFLQAQITSTTTSLTIAQCGSTIVNDSADVLTLPEASTALGCRYTFATANASNFDVNPADGTDKILGLTDAAGDAIRNATLGNSVTLEAVGADAWAPVAIYGTWTDVN